MYTLDNDDYKQTIKVKYNENADKLMLVLNVISRSKAVKVKQQEIESHLTSNTGKRDGKVSFKSRNNITPVHVT